MLDQSNELSERDRTLAERLQDAGHSWSVAFHGTSVSLTLTDKPVVGARIPLALTIGDQLARVAVDADALPPLLTAAGFSDDPNGWPGDTRALVLLHLFAPLLEALAGPFRGRVTARIDRSPDEKQRAPLCFRFSGQDIEGTFSVSCTGEVHQRILDALEKAVDGASDDEPRKDTKHLRLVSPVFEMSAKDYERLAEGDVFDLDPNCTLFETLQVFLDKSQIAGVEQSDDNFVLKTDFEDVAEAPSSRDALDVSASIPLVFEFATAEMDADRASDLCSGAVLPFKIGSASWVRIFAGDREVGSGKMVEFDGRPAIRLTQSG